MLGSYYLSGEEWWVVKAFAGSDMPLYWAESHKVDSVRSLAHKMFQEDMSLKILPEDCSR